MGLQRYLGSKKWVWKGFRPDRWVWKGLEGRASIGFNRQRRHFDRKGGIKESFDQKDGSAKVFGRVEGFGRVFDQIGDRLWKGLRKGKEFDQKDGSAKVFGRQVMGLDGFLTRWVGLEGFGRRASMGFDRLQ